MITFRKQWGIAGVVALAGALLLATPASAHNSLNINLAGQSTTNAGNDTQSARFNWRLRFALDAALREHAALTVPALKAQLLAEPDAPALMNAVERNNVAVITTVGGAYPGTQDQFNALWRQHIQYYLDYLNAAKQGDETGKAQAKQNLANFAASTSGLLASASPRLDQALLEQQLATHGDQVTAIIDHLVAGNYDAVYQLAHQAYEHMGMLAATLAAGRVR